MRGRLGGGEREYNEETEVVRSFVDEKAMDGVGWGWDGRSGKACSEKEKGRS